MMMAANNRPDANLVRARVRFRRIFPLDFLISRFVAIMRPKPPFLDIFATDYHACLRFGAVTEVGEENRR
jgi:hypothetical protein